MIFKMSDTTHEKLRHLIRSNYFHIIIIALLGLLVYSNTFNVPFQWDDQRFILENPVVKNLNYFIEPSELKGSSYHVFLKQ